MATSKQLKILATRPHEYVKFMQTGRLPQMQQPTSPLITLFESIGARDLPMITGVTIDQRLGYSGYRQFQYASQAMLWVKPSNEVHGSFAADSWRMKQFNKTLYLEDLADCCATFPEQLFDRNPRLCRPVTRSAARPPGP